MHSSLCERGTCLADEGLVVAQVCEGPEEGPAKVAGPQDLLDTVTKVAAGSC